MALAFVDEDDHAEALSGCEGFGEIQNVVYVRPGVEWERRIWILNQQANTSGSTPAKKAASFEVAYFLM